MNFTDIKAHPAHRHAYAELLKGGELGYGKVISWERMLELFGMTKPQQDTWDFRGQYLMLKEHIEADGYLLTESEMNNQGVRLLMREEMADVVKSREHRKANDSLRKSLILGKVPRLGLGESDVKSLDHWELKTALLGATSKAVLRRHTLPDPQTITPTVNQLLQRSLGPDDD